MKCSKLFEKVVLNNNVEIKNRLTVAPMVVFGANSDGSLTDEEREYLKKRGDEIGLFILGAALINKESFIYPTFSSAMSDKDIPALKERAEIIKSNGAKAICQINHAGAHGITPLVPSSDIALKDVEEKGQKGKIFHEFTDIEIKETIKQFVNAAELSIKAGYDGVEIHGANNYLIQQFYSPHTNRRTDDWGGSDEKRMKFPLQIVDEICKLKDKYNCPEFIIGYRLSPEEPYEDGLTMTETLKLVKELVKKPLQYIHISQKDYFKKARRGEGAGTERLKLIHNETKGKVALIGVGGLLTENDLIAAANSEFSEFIAVGCACLLNPNLGILLKEGKGEQLVLEIDPEHREKYFLPTNLWKMCLQGMDWMPPLKGKIKNKEEF